MFLMVMDYVNYQSILGCIFYFYVFICNFVNFYTFWRWFYKLIELVGPYLWIYVNFERSIS